ncbi:hypothetical protein PIB30_050651 [Stylosanthes scabra]|uniref:Uncharacterized protein n=1 Tax=Stylosanthes scabra TaxID=79078 RepID=A0ABU6WFQ3_9FABA|nr:hypothetical protein [Stylosanthes scabra]
MEYECTPLSWEFFYQEEQGLEELRHSLLFTSLELEATIESAKVEIASRECELHNVNELLAIAIKERDEAQAKCKKLELQATTTTSNNEENEIQPGSYSSSASESEQNSSSSSINQNQNQSRTTSFEEVMMELAEKRPLPEKGKLLKAVVEAGPLLQSILLAGPLPQWQHPPPQLTSIEIPPITIPKGSITLTKKRERDLSSISKQGAAQVDFPNSKCIKTTPTPLPTISPSHHSLPPPPPSFS